MIIRGGLQGQPGNPFDAADEGVFISKINSDSVADHQPGLKVGQRIIEVNGQSLLGATHQEAVAALRNAGDSIHLLLCDGFEDPAVSTPSLPAIEKQDIESVKEQSVPERPNSVSDQVIN